MHELSIAQNIVDIVTDEAQKVQAKRVLEVAVDVGAVSGIVPESLEFVWTFAIQDTLLEGAVLVINVIEPKAVCNSCTVEFKIDGNFSCPNCNGSDYEVLLGRELKVRSFKVD